MKVSVITCTWNSAATLGDTLDSVAAQTHPDVEHVFVDGGSTDGTLEIIRARCPGAVLIENVGGGISRAMNVGTRAATGDIVCHLHSDDFFVDERVLADVVQRMRVGDAWLIGRVDFLKGTVIERRHVPVRRFSGPRYAAGSAVVEHPATFIRRDVLIERGGFDESLRYAMDIDLWFRMAEVGEPARLDRSLTVFRMHDGSLSTANVMKAREEEWIVRKRYARRYPLQTLIFSARRWNRLRKLRASLGT